MTSYYLCPETSCHSVCVVVQEFFNVLANTCCQHGHGFVVPLDSLVPIEQWVDKNTSDGHHTFEELYRYRLLYNAALFNEWAKAGLYDVHKSLFHHDGTIPFGDRRWFIVVAELPAGQISNHYRMPDWDLFDIPVKGLPNVYDGHTPEVVADRLASLLEKRDES